MAITRIRGENQIQDYTVTTIKLGSGGDTPDGDFLQATDWNITNGNNNATITGVKDPVNPRDVATKQYVDNAAAGLDPKESVRVATTGILTGTGFAYAAGQFTWTATNGPTRIDGITLADDDRILVKDQADAKQNGIYVRTNQDQWDRADDQDGTPANEVSGGNFTFVEQGTANIGTGWVVTGDGILTLDTDDIDWVQFNAATAYTAGDGIDITSYVISVDLDATSGLEFTTGALQVNLETDGGIVLDGTNDGLEINVDGSSLTIATNQLQIATDGVDETHLDFGSGSNQIDSSSIPIDTGGSIPTPDTIQGVLEDLYAVTYDVTKVWGELPSLNTGADTATLANTPNAGTERVYHNGIRQIRGASYDYTISGTVITFTYNALKNANDQVTVDYEYPTP